MKIKVKMGKKDMELYKKLGVKPDVFLWWIHREVIKILEQNLDPYGTINNLDEEDLAEWIILSAKLKKNNRLKMQEKIRYEALDRERKKEKLGSSKRSKFYKETTEALN